MPQQRFQVNLGGVIDLLSNHLYSTPAVFIRELLQNATDAIRARQRLQAKHAGAIRLSLEGEVLTLSDDGVGLTEDEVHQFLATIGESSKRGALPDPSGDFIGQFGIGLLSCFIVSREIVVLTRSSKSEDAATLEWRGRDDGTYAVEKSKQGLEAPGTRVILTARADRLDYFEPDRVETLARQYGGLLPIPITLEHGGRQVAINPDPPPWKRAFEDARERRESWLEYGRVTFQTQFIDVLPLRSKVGDVQGLAFVLPSTAHFGGRQKHRVYLKHMLLSEDAEDLLPPWAFFVRCVVNANDLRPTANREAFYDGDGLAAVREALGTAIRDYLMTMARESPAALQKLMSLHALAMRSLALDDDEFFRLVADWFQFETSLGVMTLGEYRRAHAPVRYVTTVEEFQQVARVAGAQGVAVLNGGYVHGADLIQRLADLFPEVEVERFSVEDLTAAMEELSLDERAAASDLLACAEATLRPFSIEASVKKFHPTDVPALYALSQAQLFDRDAARVQDASDPLFSGIVSDLRKAMKTEVPQLVLNLDNPVVRRLASLRDPDRLRVFVELLYVQALLLGQHPLQARELAILNKGLVSLMAAQLEAPAARGGGGLH